MLMMKSLGLFHSDRGQHCLALSKRDPTVQQASKQLSERFPQRPPPPGIFALQPERAFTSSAQELITFPNQQKLAAKQSQEGVVCDNQADSASQLSVAELNTFQSTLSRVLTSHSPDGISYIFCAAQQESIQVT